MGRDVVANVNNNGYKATSFYTAGRVVLVVFEITPTHPGAGRNPDDKCIKETTQTAETLVEYQQGKKDGIAKDGCCYTQAAAAATTMLG